MSTYFDKKRRGWRYEFTLKGVREASSYFKTKAEAREAEAKRREEIKNPKPLIQTPTDMDFLELVNKRLDYVQVYDTQKYYRDNKFYASRWNKQWRGLSCSQIMLDMVQAYIIKWSAKVSAANADLRCLRATFNFGIKRNWLSHNPTAGIEFLPLDKKVKYVPSKEDVLKVIMAADYDTKDYLWTIIYTMGRINEINQMKWEDVNFEERYVVLYTRKKKGRDRTPRKVPMSNKLFNVLSYRYKNRDKTKPWVFWHRYWSRRNQDWLEGPYIDRKRIMETLSKKAKVKYFRYHALRHFGASMLDNLNANIGAIQRILGHENRSTTEIYLQSIGKAEREAMGIFERELENHHADHHANDNRATAIPATH